MTHICSWENILIQPNSSKSTKLPNGIFNSQQSSFCFFFLLQRLVFVKLSEEGEGGRGGGGKGRKEVRLLRIPETRA